MRLRLLLLALIGTLAGCDVKIEPGGIEPAPKEFRGKGPAPGVSVQQFPTREEVQRACEAAGITWETFRGKNKLRACYDPKTKTVFIIERGKIPDYEWQEEFSHEAEGHGNGLVHVKNGRGWKPANVFAQQQPMVFDWANVFAPKAQETPATGTGNIFRDR